MFLSVIIPTHNRADILKTCLQRLEVQTHRDFEVIVVDDGSTDGTEKMVQEQIARQGARAMNQMGGALKLRYIKQAASQQGVARNRGVKESTGEVVIFIGDDIWVEPDFLEQHVDLRSKMGDSENVVVLGFTTWDPAMEINDYMRFLEASGWQFGYGFLKPGWVAPETSGHEPWKFFYTSNISMKKSFFEKEKFDESFRGYGWEDIELGYRLFKNQGMRLWYAPAARAVHHHFIAEAELPKKMQAIGKSAVMFQKMHPEARVIPSGLKLGLIRFVCRLKCERWIQKISKNLYFKIASWREFLRGMENTDLIEGC